MMTMFQDRMKNAVCGLCFVTLSACAPIKQNYQEFKNKPNAYLKSQCSPELRVPAGIEHEPLLADDRVPPGEVPQKAASLLPPESLAQKVAEGKVSPKALKRVSRSELQEKDHVWVLMITDEPDRVWKKLEKALNRRKLRILQKNQEIKVYYILDTYPTDGKITLKTPIYQVHLRATEEQNTEIYLLDNDGHKPNAAVAQRLLTEIQQGLQGHAVHELPNLLKKLLTEQ
ncbi:MAG: hypothetical protein HY939_03510 [Gammaproteobacteria bacterium]|nr:hypothetical protein [Gammaproteobacteria bacterium]